MGDTFPRFGDPILLPDRNEGMSETGTHNEGGSLDIRGLEPRPRRSGVVLATGLNILVKQPPRG